MNLTPISSIKRLQLHGMGENMISKEEVEAAQNAWATGLLEIGSASSWEESHRLADALVRKLYVTDGSLLFCPTLVQEKSFRSDIEGSVSYFVGQNPTYAEDKGFALKGWTHVRFDNAGIVTGDTALAMGHYFFTDGNNAITKVEYTFAYCKDDSGAVKIQLHHSALPFSG